MARKKKEAGQAELGAAGSVEPRPASEVPKAEVLEYQPISTEKRWRVERWEWLAAELESTSPGAAIMPLVHEALRRFARSWLIVRRLFGVMPVVIDLGGDPDDFRVWGREEICEKLGITKAELQQELLSARAVVQRVLGSHGSKSAEEKPIVGPEWAPESAAAIASAAALALPETADGYLASMGYARRMFEIQIRSRIPGQETISRSAEENRMEVEWFAGRVRQFEKLLKDRLVSRLADQVLRNELRLRRVEDELSVSVIGSTEHDALMKVKGEVEKTYERQLAQLNEQAPWFNATEKEMAAKDAFSEVVRAIREYQSRGDRRLVDGLFTQYELQVLVRTSVQKPAPDYRFGWMVFILQSREFLWDPNWQPKFRASDLKKLDAGFRDGVRRYVEESGERVPDLLKEGEAGEYEDLLVVNGNEPAPNTLSDREVH